jgi:integrase
MPDDLRAHCGAIAERGAPATAIHVRDIVKQIYGFAILHGEKVANAVWTVPKERMKRSKAHNVYLSRQALDIMIALKTCAGNSRYLLRSRYGADAPMSRATNHERPTR